nr:hypothetical protein [Photobacterium leiognathi]
MSQELLYDFAVGLLAKRDYASGEIRRQLSKQGDNELVEQVMEKLLYHHYLDDTRLAEREISKQIANSK